MKNVYCFTVITLLALALTGCGSVLSTPTPIPTVMLDDGAPVDSQPDDANAVMASAVIVPVNEARLSFTSVGRVTAVNVSVGDRVTAGQTLVTLDTSIQEAKIREAEANLLTAQVDLKYKKRLGLDEVHLETAEAEVARMQALLDSAHAVLAAQSSLIAPFDGTIVSLDTAPAETVVPGQVVIVLGDLSSYQIETTDLSERDVTRVQPGEPARVYIEALSADFTGEVVDIDRLGSTLGGDVVYTVTIELDRQPQGLLWGMSADVQIKTAE
jgi:RND family efflux transporter MFP subunit